jgi:site-specific DNA-methyltransferase (adenine-specific)
MEINKIHKGDCLDIMAQMPNEFVDCIVTDPPYFMPAVHYNTRKEFKRNFADLGIMDSWFKSVFKEFKRILKPNGTIYMFCDGQSYPLFYWHTYHFAKNNGSGLCEGQGIELQIFKNSTNDR